MIPSNIRVSRKNRRIKMSKNMERLYKDSKCRECSVAVTRMDFAKILGKFTKVKIQYESSSPKAKQNLKTSVSPRVNNRLKTNENGMVMINRKAFNPHPVKQPKVKNEIKKAKVQETSTPQNNILKEHNRIKKSSSVKNSNLNVKLGNTQLKRYGLVFTNQLSNTNLNDGFNNFSLTELLPKIDYNILPSEEWCIDFFPKNDEPKDDKVYDRIAAELEDLMYNKIEAPEGKTETKEKTDEFPSIMDILNDTADNKNKDDDKLSEFKSETESNDVEAMLLGENKETEKDLKLEEDTPNISNLIEDVNQFNTITEEIKNSDESKSMEIDRVQSPGSPSIIDEAIKMGIEKHLPTIALQDDCPGGDNTEINDEKTTVASSNEEPKESARLENKLCIPKTVTHVVFKKNVNDNCVKSVTCLKSLRYQIELDGKSVDFLGAPMFISSLEDLIVLLQIVNETKPEFLYVRQ